MSTSPSLIATIKRKISDLLKIERPWFSKAVKYIVIAFLCILIGFPLYIFTVNINLFGLYGDMPNTRDVENPENDLSSELISSDGVLLGRYIRFNRSQVMYEDLSEDLVNTLLLSEDHRFYDHSGLDFIAFLRVVKGLVTFSPAGGGSTITQQIAKNLYTHNPDKDLDGHIAKLGRYPRRIVEKTKEWIIAVGLEQNFTKEEIIAMYLNTSAFSNNAYGIKVAAETYFNKSPDSLNVQESAVLIGMLQAITRFNPVSNPEKSLRKRNEVLGKLYSHRYIKTKKEYDSIIALPIELQYRVENQNTGLAPYFRSAIQVRLKQICKERGIDLEISGLKIYTTIDSRLQRYAEEAVDEHMRTLQGQFDKEWGAKNPWVDEDFKEITGFLNSRLEKTETYKNLVAQYGEKSDSIRILLKQKKQMTIFTWRGERDTLFSSLDSLNYYKRFLQTGFMSMDPTTGHIKAWVGGVNHKFFKFDHVRQGKRQPGSTFKSFVYGLAMESGYSPCTPMIDIAPSIYDPGSKKTWTPSNSSPPYQGSGETFTLRQAMARSLNTITAQMIAILKPINVVEFAHRVGIQSKLDTVYSLALGVSDVSVSELVGAYSTFVNSGIYTEPFFITRIEDKNGNVIENFVPKTRQSLNEQTAYKMVYMLRGGVEEEGGTSGGLNRELRIDNEIGGKTGTTDNASDGWYVGITPKLVSGGWVGGDERSIHFPSWGFGAGGKTARPIWEKYMLKAYADPATGIQKGQFKRPASGLDIQLDCNRYVTESGDTLQTDVKPFDIN